jgi:hypothetical protein
MGTKYFVDDEDTPDVLQDGDSLCIPLRLLDNAPGRGRIYHADAATALRDVVEAAYDARTRQMENAWRKPLVQFYRDANPDPETLQEEWTNQRRFSPGAKRAPADPAARSAAEMDYNREAPAPEDAQLAAQRAYEDHKRYLANAWRAR